MNKHITFRNMDSSEVMETHANQQLAKIEEFLSHERSPINIHLILEASKTREHHKVELIIKTPNYDKVVSYEHQGTKFYDAIDHVIDVMYLELHEAKRKLVAERHHGRDEKKQA